jgi:DNA-binding NarL/FixJ family response regulator
MSAKKTPIRIVIADDHPLFLEGLKLLLQSEKERNIELVGEAQNGKELLYRIKSCRPQIVITDIRMPVMDGIDACKLIKKHHPAVGVIALSMYSDDDVIYNMLQAGVNAYLLKDLNKEELFKAIEIVINGENYYCCSIHKRIISLVTSSKQNASRKKEMILTSQELEIIRLICDQLTTKEIAELLNLSPRTVEDHRHIIQEKLGARNMIGIVLFAIKNNIIHLAEIK